jgi:hypothetical protein
MDRAVMWDCFITSAVIAGLDPAIHPLREKPFQAMDTRVI